MRVLITTDSFPPGCGGSGWSTFELARGLAAIGHDVSIVHLRAGARGRRQRAYEGLTIDEHGVFAPRVPYLRNYFKNERTYRRFVPVLREIIRTERVDVVHAQHVLSSPPAVAAARGENVPVVCTVRDYWPVCYWSDLIREPSGGPLCPGCSGAVMRRCVRPRAGIGWPVATMLVPYMRANLRRKQAALAAASAVIAVSSVLARDLAERAPELAATTLYTIPNPVDLDVIVGARRRDHPLDGQPYAIYVGKLAPNKGTSLLIPAVERAKLPWPLIVIGDGPDREAMERSARATGRVVRFFGWMERTEVLTWLAHASLVVFPSYGPESLSRVLLESSALGRPIAAMDTGGTRDIILDGGTGLLARDPGEFSTAIARLVGDRQLADSLGARAAAFVREQFDSRSVVARIDALYRALVAGLPRPRPEHAS